MKRFTISIPEKLKEKLDKRPEINWSEIAKKAVETKLERLNKGEI